MLIKRLKIENFRGIREMELVLHPKMNVFIGVNGSGKSSVLDALGYLLQLPVNVFGDGAYTNGVLHHKGNDFPDTEITLGKTESRLRIVASKDDGIYLDLPIKSSKPFYQNDSHLRDPVSGTQRFYSYAKEEVVISSVIVYYRAHRAVKDVPIEAWANRNFNRRDAYKEALSQTDFREFFQWFRNREDLENENRAEGATVLDTQIESVRKAIAIFMGSVSDVKVRRRNPLRMIVMKDGKELRIEQLSDGEKCLLALVGDIARRLAIANPRLNTPLDGKGIILIDEVDLHLHPQWQRMILPKLMETFPKCQFIVSTHSPQILGELRSENVFILSDGENGIEARRPAYEIYGQTSGILLEDMMQTPERDATVQEKIDRIFMSIERGELEEAQREYEELKSIAADLPEFVKIDMRLGRKGIGR